MSTQNLAELLQSLASGRTMQSAADAMREIVAAVQETGKTGELTIKLKFSKNSENSVTVKDDIKVKVPEMARGASVFYVTADGRMQRNDPEQPVMGVVRDADALNAAKTVKVA